MRDSCVNVNPGTLAWPKMRLWTESSAEAEAKAKAKAKPTLAKRTELELSTESSAEAMEAALSMAEAVYNSRAPKTATGLFGVALDRRRLQRPYVARVWRGGKLVRLGTFATAENAALAVARSPEGALRLIGTRAVAAAEAAAAAGKEAAAVAVEAARRGDADEVESLLFSMRSQLDGTVYAEVAGAAVTALLGRAFVIKNTVIKLCSAKNMFVLM